MLRRYMSEQTKTQYLAYNDGVVGGLVAATVIWRASNLSSYFTNFAYNIQPWAWDYLTKHPELLLSAEELEEIRSKQLEMMRSTEDAKG